MTDTDLIAAARTSRAWPFQEAQKLLRRYPHGARPDGGPVVFETGYGPSGLPHIGTFQEVLRTTFVRRAFEALIGAKPEDGRTRLIAFSDDMDGLRKVPDNVPGQAMLAGHLGKPLSRVPNPFDSEHESFAAHNNAMLRAFLDRFGFDYEFVSASERYGSGAFDDALRLVLRHNQAILDIMLPSLREERRRTYSPILPISPATGRVLQVPVEVLDAEAGLIRFADEDGRAIDQSALGGQAKLQWKVDWAMRWYSLGVDYEMYGKDLTDSGVQSGRIVEVLGGQKPEGLIYELFLDERGEKISKSKGNGLTIEEWLTYGSPKSLGFYIFPNPRSAKALHPGVIPRAVDDYWQARALLAEQPLEKQLGNPVWHLDRAGGTGASAGSAPAGMSLDATSAQPELVDGTALPVSYSLLLNLVGVLGAEASAEQVWSYLTRYTPNGFDIGWAEAIQDDFGGRIEKELRQLIDSAIAYNRDFVAPTLRKRAPTANEAAALRALDTELAALDPSTGAEALQTLVYEIGKQERFGFANLRDWFRALYETLLGSEQGPRMGSFIALYGIPETRRLIAEALAR
ncbi:lysine--tRNA ligase [Qipengyuania sediminis]|uniref:lysine--tRNA ligase n=1 Tax=Qipengyuania sediminis TaxID=1532023 RepID=UPI00105A4770|nr:lysine--tRNA ligase [Qipengyuania sediminis]